MTRFARAKGSKSSNERLPETSTSWTEMKSQLLEKNKDIEETEMRKSIQLQRNQSHQKFLDEKEKDEVKQSKWAEIPDVGSSPGKSLKANQVKNKRSRNGNAGNKVNKKLKKVPESQAVDSEEMESSDDDDQEVHKEFVSLKKKLDFAIYAGSDENVSAVIQSNSESDEAPEEVSSKIEQKIEIKKMKNKKKLLKIVVHKEEISKTNGISDKVNTVKQTKKIKGDKKKVPERKVVNLEDLPEVELKKIEKKKAKRLRQLEKKKKKKEELKKLKEADNGNESQDVKEHKNKIEGSIGANIVQTNNNKNQSNNKKKLTKSNIPSNIFRGDPKDGLSKVKPLKKIKKQDDGEHPRRKPVLPQKVVIDGKDVELSYYDGFPIKKEDAHRLKTLRKQMISKGLPRSEINIALKLERRKAEKALTREKKKVCFNCRKYGHNLSECPELGKSELIESAGVGLCFKCGSTEHTHYQCRVVKGAEYKFASCFICKEPGHISRQCPDNARGLYPKGGACRACGDVTHLKKDCPQFQAQQQKDFDRADVSSYTGGNPDNLDNDDFNAPNTKIERPNKIIKF